MGKENKCEKCNHPLEEHAAELGCGVPVPEWEDMLDYCNHCQEDWEWQRM